MSFKSHECIFGWEGFRDLKGCNRMTGYIPRERFLDPPAPPPPINFVHGSYMLDIDIIDHVAASLDLLACPSRSARPRKCVN